MVCVFEKSSCDEKQGYTRRCSRGGEVRLGEKQTIGKK